MDSILLGMVAPQAILFLATIGLVWAGIRQGLAPLALVRAQIAQRSHHDLRPLDTKAVPEELRPVVEDINHLFERLKRKIEAQRHFVADAAHQLRTPVAALMAQVESTSSGDQALLDTTRRLSHLVTQLLALSRAEPGIRPPMERFDLAAQIRAAANDWLPHAFRRDMEVDFDLVETWIVGSPHALREMLANLVDNAIRYGRAQGRIVVSCRPQGEEAMIRVDDDGPGIPAELRRQAFERFFRVPGTPGDGCGLGLAIVKAFVLQHSGSVALDEAPELGGLRVEIRIPLASA
jgi:two-component system sensor histidine kinase TctE